MQQIAIEMNQRQINIDEKIPALRIALTTRCNSSCVYCSPKGENFADTEGCLSIEKLSRILHIFYEIGFRQFGFTGGEPLLRKDLHLILRECSEFKDIFLKLYTNGLLLKEKIEILKEINLIKVSLDSINREKYKELTGKDRLTDVLRGIEAAKKNKIKIRINSVLTQKNHNDIFNLIDFCRNKEIDLKILDLNCFDMPGYLIWQSHYKGTSGIVDFLERKGLSKKVIYTTGNYGIPMPEFRWEGVSIRIKDTNNCSMYSPICRSCKYFLCQEGLYHLTLICDGKLKLCKHRPDIYIDLSRKTNSQIKKGISHFLNEHYFSAQRLFFQKQVFSGYFGISSNGKRE